MYLFQIKDFLERKLPGKNAFVTSVDCLPRRVSLPVGICSNLSNAGEPGSHWVGITITSDGVGEYFDSYGFKPTSPEILHFLKMHCKSWSFNKHQVQQLQSKVCGLYAVMYLYYKLNNVSMTQYIKHFSKNLYLNDYYVEKMYVKFNN